MFTKNILDKIHEIDIHGFAIFQNVLEDEYLYELKQVLKELYNQSSTEHSLNSNQIEVANDGAGKIVGGELLRNLPTRNPKFFPLIDHPLILPIIEYFLGKEIILGSMNARILEPGAKKQKFHSDIPDVLRKSDKPIMLNTAWIINDFTDENGPTEFIPGTHLHHASIHPPDFQPKHIVKAIAPAGSVILFNGQCWHRGGENNSKDFRAAIFAQYRVGYWMRFQWDPHINFPVEWWEKLSPRQKQLLRMEKGVGSNHSADNYD